MAGSNGDRCEVCEYVRRKIDLRDRKPTTFFCHKNPPVAMNEYGEAAWPMVEKHDWCGGFEVRREEMRF